MNSLSSNCFSRSPHVIEFSLQADNLLLQCFQIFLNTVQIRQILVEIVEIHMLQPRSFIFPVRFFLTFSQLPFLDLQGPFLTPFTKVLLHKSYSSVGFYFPNSLTQGLIRPLKVVDKYGLKDRFLGKGWEKPLLLAALPLLQTPSKLAKVASYYFARDHLPHCWTLLGAGSPLTSPQPLPASNWPF